MAVNKAGAQRPTQEQQAAEELSDADLEQAEKEIASLDAKLHEESKQHIFSPRSKLTVDFYDVTAKNGSVQKEVGEIEDDLEDGEIAGGPEEAEDPNERSVFVKNVDFSISEEQL